MLYYVVLVSAVQWESATSSVQSLSHVQLFVTPWTEAHQASLSITNFQSLPKLMSMESVILSNHLILCHPLLLLCSIFSNIRVFSNESVLCVWWPKYWTCSLSISPSNEYSGLISFSIDWLDLLAGQGTLKSLLQHHGSKASILWRSTFFIVQLSHPYIGASLVAQTVKNLPALWETWVWSLGQEDPLEKGMATHSSTLVWRFPWTEELQSMELQRAGHNWATNPNIPSLWSLPPTPDPVHLDYHSEGAELPMLYSSFPLAMCFTRGIVYMSMLISHSSHHFHAPLCPQVCSFHLSLKELIILCF